MDAKDVLTIKTADKFEENWNVFSKKVKELIQSGKEKYIIQKDKGAAFQTEAIDIIIDLNPDYPVAVMLKYIIRFFNKRNSEDLLKIAHYAQIAWTEQMYREEWEKV